MYRVDTGFKFSAIHTDGANDDPRPAPGILVVDCR
jgi:hypothetical protein